LRNIYVANFNSPSQTVISGLKEDINQIGDIFKEAGARLYIPLKVSGAFHSLYMKTAKDKFEQFLQSFHFSDLTIPVISNIEARPYTKEKIKQLLADQITHSVKWTESIRYLMGKNVKKFVELGTGNVLTRLVGQIKKETEPLIVVEEVSSVEEKETEPEQKKKIATKITASSLGSKQFKDDYHIKYPYVADGMYKGIASKIT